MNDRIPCGLEDDRCRLEPDNLDHARAVEDYADNLMAECKTPAGAAQVNYENDLYDSNLLSCLMAEIANWQGSGASAISQMHKLHNILADALQAIAEREVA